MSRWYVSGLLACAVTGSAHAEESERRLADDPDRFQGRGSVSLSTQAGRTKVPYPANYHPEADGVIVAQRLRAHYRVLPDLDVGVLLPVASGFVFLPARLEHADAWLVGNPQLFGFQRFEPTRRLEVQTGVSIGLPMGSGSGAPAGELHTNRILALASGILGWKNPELFSPRRLTLTPSAELRWREDALGAGVELRLPFMLQTEGEDDDQSSLNRVGSAAVLSARWSVSPWHWLFLTHRGWLAYNVIWNAEAAQFHPDRAQVVVQSELGFVFGRALFMTINYLQPVGGPLFGELQSGGANLTATF
jgi:hypothetical protein